MRIFSSGVYTISRFPSTGFLSRNCNRPIAKILFRTVCSNPLQMPECSPKDRPYRALGPAFLRVQISSNVAASRNIESLRRVENVMPADVVRAFLNTGALDEFNFSSHDAAKRSSSSEASISCKVRR